MEGENVWKATEEEEVAEDESGGLEIRQRKKGEMGKDREAEVVNGEENSVYFEADKGAEVGDVTVGLKSAEVDIIVAERRLQNGKADIGAREFNDHKNVPIEENHHVKNAVSENGSKSYLSSESSNGITRKENEIQESEQFKPGNSSNVMVKEFDVERVVEEQETHDLFCPNCHSCITKRVILRKRKRLYRESQSDLPREEVLHDTEVNSAPTETADLQDEQVFRCLSCFSFFIPTDSGFNIFRIFGKRDGRTDLQSSAKIPARKVNWVTSIFGSGSSKDKGSEAGVPLLAESTESTTVESGPVSSRDPSLGLQPKSPHVPTPGSADLGDKGSSTGMNNADLLAGANEGRGDKESYPGPTKAEDLLAGANEGRGDKESYPGPTISEDLLAGANEGQGNKESYPGPTISEGNGTDKTGGLAKPPFLQGIISSSNEDIYTSMPPATGYSNPVKNINMPASPIPELPATVETILDVGVQGIEESRRGNEWDVLKSIVYGGLMESIASLCVVSSAAGSGSSTLNICALGLANLIGGLLVIAHDLSELKSEHDTRSTNQRDQQTSRYYVKLGKREHFRRHAVVSILSYIIFGLLPPVIYGFTFRKSDNKEYKLIAVAASSMLGVAVLAICKAQVRPQKGYIKSLFYYMGLALPACGLCYVAGVMIDKLLVELGLSDQSTISPSPPSVKFIGFGSGGRAWTSR